MTRWVMNLAYILYIWLDTMYVTPIYVSVLVPSHHVHDMYIVFVTDDLICPFPVLIVLSLSPTPPQPPLLSNTCCNVMLGFYLFAM